MANARQELWLAESVIPPPREKCSAQACLPGSLQPCAETLAWGCLQTGRAVWHQVFLSLSLSLSSLSLSSLSLLSLSLSLSHQACFISLMCLPLTSPCLCALNARSFPCWEYDTKNFVQFLIIPSIGQIQKQGTAYLMCHGYFPQQGLSSRVAVWGLRGFYVAVHAGIINVTRSGSRTDRWFFTVFHW